MVLPRKFPVNKDVLRRVVACKQPKPGEQYIVNRNPRNLEQLRIAYKNRGYDLDAPFSKEALYWHKLEVTPSSKFVTAQVIHFENGPVVEASTKEWCIKKQLYKTVDTAAYVNLARVFAQRCLMSGIVEMVMKPAHHGPKMGRFIEILHENGISLIEPTDIHTSNKLDLNRYVGRRMTPLDWKEIVEHH